MHKEMFNKKFSFNGSFLAGCQQNARDVLCSQADADMKNLASCSHEEAETHLLLHVNDAVQKGCRKACVHTIDLDIVVTVIAMFNKIKPDELWVALGTGSHFWYIPVHKLGAILDPRMCATLPVFHALIGCGMISAFGGRGKKTAWDTWKCFPEATEAFEDLLLMHSDISDPTLSVLEWFVVLLYECTNDAMEVNVVRKQLFMHKSRSLENLPPTLAALEQHIKRVCYQSNCWSQALTPEPKLPSLGEWGWRMAGSHSGPPFRRHCSHATS